MHRITSILLLTLSFSSIALAQDSRSAISYLDRAMQHYAKGDLEATINDLDAADLKMRNAYRTAGVPLAWLVVIEEASLYIYRPNMNRVKFNWNRIVGDSCTDSNTGVLPGFQLNLIALHNIVARAV